MFCNFVVTPCLFVAQKRVCAHQNRLAKLVYMQNERVIKELAYELLRGITSLGLTCYFLSSSALTM